MKRKIANLYVNSHKRKSYFLVRKFAKYLLLVIISLVSFFYIKEPLQRYSTLAQDKITLFFLLSGLKLENVYIEGRYYTTPETITNSLNLELGTPIFSIDLNEVKTSLESIDWIKYAVVERILPNTINLKIVERTPIAFWQNNGKLFLLDDEGVLISENNLKQFKNLPIFVGDDAPLHGNMLIKIISEDKELYQHIVAAIRIGERRWNIRLDNGTEIKLPADNLQKAWEYVIKLFKNKKLLDINIKSIDLRIPDKIYIYPKK